MTMRQYHSPRMGNGSAGRRRGTLVAVLVLALVAVSGCSGAAAKPTMSTATRPAATFFNSPTPPAARLPVFSDWRAGYMDASGTLHAVSLDGRQDSAGQVLVGLSTSSLVFQGVAVSRDGHRFAYDAAGLTVYDLAQGTLLRPSVAGSYQLLWSPDGNRLLISEGIGTFVWFDMRTQQTTTVPGTPNKSIGHLIGWIDSTHVAVEDIAGATTVSVGKDTYLTSDSIAILDLQTGSLRVIARFSSPGLGDVRFTMSPGGAHILISNAPFRFYPYTPLAEVVDTATGYTRVLPGFERVEGNGFTSVAWQPHSSMLAASTGDIGNGGAQMWLLNSGTDTAIRLSENSYAGGWSPDGSTLVLTTGNQFETGAGLYTLTALRFDANWQVTSSTVLTNAAMTFPFLGFIRTG